MTSYHSDRARLLHIKEAIALIFSYIEEDPSRGNRTRDAVIRQLEIIGEASNRLSVAIKERYDHVPWRLIVGMRHHLSHGYFQIEIKDVWDTVDNDLQPLQDTILAMLEDKTIV